MFTKLEYYNLPFSMMMMMIIYQVLIWLLDIGFIKSILCHLLGKPQTPAHHCHPAALRENTCHYILPTAQAAEQGCVCGYPTLYLTLGITWEFPGLNFFPLPSFYHGPQLAATGGVSRETQGTVVAKE